MSVKDNFTPDEWFKVMTGPGRAGAAVVAASPSGVTGLVAEAQAIATALREQVSASGRTPLLEAMAADLMGTPPDPKTLPREERTRSMDEARDRSVEGVRQAVWLVSSKASAEDAAAYRRLLLTVAQRTAEAAKEGGFLGFGGEQVNDKERAVLEELRRVIGVAGETAPVTDPALLHPGPDGSGNSN
ncbi:hypothetical protein [Deinococcus hopiensis]|uniref:Uncharacterized protein n=1 Tax=Deinococcus hopiensis KR-140 TaxID=695939 RepID=A0A1W1VM20_9DEIO|nr:hypothetical protein [Deinococcus hopiensis]SMB94366.1 hypothetical protein SAMN00790413_02359 [Deinococcus hopiensis KR-140]